MNNNPDSQPIKHPPIWRAPVRQGALVGLLAGFCLAILYALVLGVLFMISGSGFSGIALFAAAVGVLPASILGCLSGLSISWLVRTYASGSLVFTQRIGILVPLVVVALISSVLTLSGGFLGLVFWGTYLFFPALVYIATGLWGATYLYHRLDTTHRTLVPNRGLERLVTSLLVLMVIGGISGLVFSAWPRTIVEHHPMRWEILDVGHCADYVTLEFVEAPGYQIATCSTTLAASLRQEPTLDVVVEMVATYTVFVWEYDVTSVGNWHGKTTWEGVSLVCRGVAQADGSTTYACGQNESPIRQPYRWK